VGILRRGGAGALRTSGARGKNPILVETPKKALEERRKGKGERLNS